MDADKYTFANMDADKYTFANGDTIIYRHAYKYAFTNYLYRVTGTNSVFYFNLGQWRNRQWAVWKPVGTGSKQQRRRVCSGL